MQLKTLLVFAQGLDSYADQLLIGLTEQGVKVVCVTDPHNREAFAKYQSKLPVFDSVRLNGRLDRAAAQKYSAIIAKVQPDICLCYTSRALSVALKARRVYGLQVPIIGTRGAIGGLSAWYIQDWFSYLAPSLNAVVCFSQAIADKLSAQARRFSRAHPGRFVAIHQGYDHIVDSAVCRQHQQRASEPTRVILSLTNERPIKGMSVLLDALEFHVQQTHWQLVWVGEVLKSTRDRIEKSSVLRERVRCMGYRSDARSFLPLADMYVQPTIAPGEGIGNAIAEAMASELPIITSNVGGSPELIGPVFPEHQIFESGNARSLAACIDRLLLQPALSETIGMANRARLSAHFTRRKELEKYLQLFDSVLPQQPVPVV